MWLSVWSKLQTCICPITFTAHVSLLTTTSAFGSGRTCGVFQRCYLHYFHTLMIIIHTHTHPFNSLCPGLPGWASTRKVKPIWILLKQETVSGSDISWTICKSAPCSRQITVPAPHHSVFYRRDALPASQPTASKHWRQFNNYNSVNVCCFWNQVLFLI